MKFDSGMLNPLLTVDVLCRQNIYIYIFIYLFIYNTVFLCTTKNICLVLVNVTFDSNYLCERLKNLMGNVI
jgi:hypothetical protein